MRKITHTELADIIGEMPTDERDIITDLVLRIERGREQYGPWSLEDQRAMVTEAYEECLDALHYVTARLLQLRRMEEGEK
jgi:hypothetical protein